jgi:predicted O-methyltransferase YrrM
MTAQALKRARRLPLHLNISLYMSEPVKASRFTRPDERALRELEEASNQLRVASVGSEEGSLLCLFALASRSATALELGGGAGYSAYWLSLGVRGKVETVEFDHERAERARQLLAKHGRANVAVIEAEALSFLRSLPKGKLYDLIFVDVLRALGSEEEGNELALLVDQRLRPKGLLLADNAQAPLGPVRAFISALRQSERYFIALCPVREGLLAAYKLPRR